jgi:hypothetical protein
MLIKDSILLNLLRVSAVLCAIILLDAYIIPTKKINLLVTGFNEFEPGEIRKKKFIFFSGNKPFRVSKKAYEEMQEGDSIMWQESSLTGAALSLEIKRQNNFQTFDLGFVRERNGYLFILIVLGAIVFFFYNFYKLENPYGRRNLTIFFLTGAIMLLLWHLIP